jgi:hypothetical protein
VKTLNEETILDVLTKEIELNTRVGTPRGRADAARCEAARTALRNLIEDAERMYQYIVDNGLSWPPDPWPSNY